VKEVLGKLLYFPQLLCWENKLQADCVYLAAQELQILAWRQYGFLLIDNKAQGLEELANQWGQLSQLLH